MTCQPDCKTIILAVGAVIVGIVLIQSCQDDTNLALLAGFFTVLGDIIALFAVGAGASAAIETTGV